MATSTIHGKVLPASFMRLKSMLAASGVSGHHINLQSGTCKLKFHLEKIVTRNASRVEVIGKSCRGVEGSVQVDLRTGELTITYS